MPNIVTPFKPSPSKSWKENIPDDSLIPCFPTPEAHIIEVRFILKSILNIDTPGQYFSASVELHMKVPIEFYAKLETHKRTELEYGRLYEFLNLMTEEKLTESWEPVGDTHMRLRAAIKGTFWETFELEHFPYDEQNLTFQLTSNIPAYAATGNSAALPDDEKGAVTCVFVKGNSKSTAHKFFPLGAVWDLASTVETAEYFSHPGLSKSQSSYSHVWSTARVWRKPSYFMWNVAVPVGLLTTMSFGVYVVPRQDAADRFSVTLTLLLTLVAYKLVVATSVPQVNYLTMLDKYSYSATFTLVALFAQHVAAVEVDTDRFDKWSFIALATIWFSCNLVMAFRAIAFHLARRQR